MNYTRNLESLPLGLMEKNISLTFQSVNIYVVAIFGPSAHKARCEIFQMAFGHDKLKQVSSND